MANRQPLQVRKFLGGRNTTASETLVKEDESPNELNVLHRPIGALTKRGGTKNFLDPSFGDGTVRGLHKLYRIEGDHYMLVYKSGVLISENETGGRITLKDDFSPNTFMNFTTLRNRSYGTNFAELPIRTDGTTLVTAELAYPEFGSQQGPGVAALRIENAFMPGVAGQFVYVYRFRADYGDEIGESGWFRTRTDRIREGVLTPQDHFTRWTWSRNGSIGTPGLGFEYGKPTITPGKAILNFSFFVGSGSPIQWPDGMKKLNVYRTLAFWHQDNNFFPTAKEFIEMPLYFVDSIPFSKLGEDWTDTTPDAALGPLAPLQPLYTPFARYVTNHNNRIFYANCNPRYLERETRQEIETDGSGFNPDNSFGTLWWFLEGPQQTSRIYWGREGWPDVIDGFQDVFPQDGDNITGIAPSGPNLIIFKKRHIYMLLGAHPDDFEIREIDSGGVGCVAPRSIATMGEQIFFLAEDGIYTWDGAGIQELSQKIRTDLLAIPKENRSFAVGVVHQSRYLLSVAETLAV